uniref:Uncharacterized protein n=1 Tax=viral metagenome TaxID=1070528 RepID=A0A6M3L274_9ZZZZ
MNCASSQIDRAFFIDFFGDNHMPWRTRGKEVQKKVNGKWVHHATAKSVENAYAMIRLLRAVKHGWKTDRV